MDSNSQSKQNKIYERTFGRLIKLRILCTMILIGFFAPHLFSQVPVIDGNPSEWPGILNNASNTKKGFRHDPFQQNGVDDQWTGGSADNDASPASNWHWVKGNSNDKGDIANAGAVLINGKLYFMGDRASESGDAQIGFWFFKNNVQPTGTGSSSSPFIGEHSNGDLLIISNFTNGGGAAQPTVYEWLGKTATAPGGPVIIPLSSANAALTTNGTQQNAPGGAAGVTMFNGEKWVFAPKSGTAGTYPSPLFFEGFVDLTAIPGLSQCFQRFLLETRNSQSISASLQDLAAGNFSSTVSVVSDAVTAANTSGPISIAAAPPHYYLSTTVDGVLNNSAYTYSWVQDPPQGPTTGTLSSTTIANPTFTANVAGTFTWTVTATEIVPAGTQGCVNSSPVTRVVTPPAGCPPISDLTLCAGASGTITATTGEAGNAIPAFTHYDWSIVAPANGATITSASTHDVTSINVHAGTTSFTVKVVVSYDNSNLSSLQSCTKLVTVNPNPNGSASPQTICSGDLTNVALNSDVTGTTFTWTAAIQTTPSGGTITGFSSCSSSCGSSIAQTLTNTGTTAGVVRYTVTPTANGCTGTPFTVDVTVNPRPTGSATPQTICSGTASSVTLNSNVTGTTFTWAAAIQTTPSGGTITGFSSCSSSCGSSIAQTLTNTGTTAGVVRYTVTPTANGCAGTPFTVDVTVNPRPTGSASPQTICSGTASSVTLNSNVTGTTFTWAAAIQTTPSGGTITGFSSCSSSCGSSIAQTLTNTGTTAGVVRYTVTPTANGCTGTPFTVDVTVNPRPTGSATPQTICSGTATSVTLNSNVTGTTFTWTAAIQTTPSGGTITGFSSCSSSCGSSIAQTLTNTGTTAGVVRYTVTPTANGCAGTPFTVDVTVNPPPSVAQPSNQTVCNGQTTTAVNFTGVATSFTWTNNNTTIGLVGSGTGNIAAFTATNTGSSPVVATVTVTPHFTNGGITCDGPSKSFTITVNPDAAPPQVTYIPPTCTESTFKVQVTNPQVGTTYKLTQMDNNVVTIGPYSSGTLIFTGLHIGQGYSVVATTAEGCKSTPNQCGTFTPGTARLVKDIIPINLVAEEPTVIAAPNPFSDQIRFSVNSPVSGKGSLEVYDILGRKVKTIYQGHIEKGVQTFEYNVPGMERANLIYVFRIGNQKISGKLINLKN